MAETLSGKGFGRCYGRGTCSRRSDPDRDLAEVARAVLDGTLDVAPLITDRTTLHGSPEAFGRMARGEGVRTLVLL
jgi:Zn-dependent alcohol dehydrogenase